MTTSPRQKHDPTSRRAAAPDSAEETRGGVAPPPTEVTWPELSDPAFAAADAGRRFGAKACALARLTAAGLRTAPAVVAPSDAFLTAVDAQGALTPAAAAALQVAVRRLAAAAAARAEGTPRLLFRLSPATEISTLGAGRPIALDDAAAAFSEAHARWASPRLQRRLAAAGGDPRCALMIQLAVTDLQRLRDVRLHDVETGAAAPTARGPDGPITPPDAAIAAAAAAEAALETLLDVDMAMSGAGPVLLAVRPAPISAQAAVAAAVRLAATDRLPRDTALLSIDPRRIEELLHPTLDPAAPRDRAALGVPASPGAAAGRLCLTAEEAQRAARSGEPAVLARVETTPEDVHGMDAAVAVLTLRGGLTSHAAVVARGLGLPCVVGAADARIDAEAGALIASDGRRISRGDWLTIDGSAGEAMMGRVPTRRPAPSGDLAELMAWADARRRMKVRANADTPAEAETAVRLGVDGVGLCRTEHMFFDPDRITTMREMILADGEADRRAALARLLPMQRDDFLRLFQIMDGALGQDGRAAPVTIRLLDPPLHEFLPQTAIGVERLAEAMGQPVDKIAKRARDLREFNPMLGKRGCRLGVAFPEIYETQAQAIFEAALAAEARFGRPQHPEIMVPLVTAVSELQLISDRIAAVAARVSKKAGQPVPYEVGIMVETPRAALMAEPLAALSAFFSFGTNDLTQMTYGLSRDDAGELMRDYVDRGVFEADPFLTLDRDGVGELIRLGAARGRAGNGSLEIGLCGEHGGVPSTIDFCEDVGFDYVSCSPYRAPIARLAAAQATIRAERRAEGPGAGDRKPLA